MAMMGKNRKDSERILDVDASMQGSMVFKDPVNLRINGKFDGTLDTKGSLMIGENADVNADIKGEIIIVAGRVSGNIHASRELKLVAPAVVTGDIDTPSLSIAEGAIFEGRSRMLDKAKMELKGIMTPEELAKYLEVDTHLVFEWANAGKLPGVKENGSWKFDRNRIEEWVAKERVE